MKFVIFSDIHGNFDALLEMFRQVENFDITGFIFCGDIMGYFSHQQEIIHCFQQLKNLYAVIGNHDFNYLASFNDIKQQEKFAQKYGKSYRNKLTEYERSFLERLPKTIELQCMKKRIFITHGALENYLEGRIYPDLSGKCPPGGRGRASGLSGAQERLFYGSGLGPVPWVLCRGIVRP